MKITKDNAGNLIYLGFEEKSPEIHAEIKKSVDIFTNKRNWKWKKNEILVIDLIDKDVTVILGGLGKEEEITSETVRKISAKAASEARKIKLNKVTFKLDVLKGCKLDNFVKAAVEGIELSKYKFDKYLKKEEEENAPETEFLFGEFEADVNFEELICEAEILSESVCIARDLVNEPANVITPVTLAGKVEELGKVYNFDVEIFEEEKIRKLKMDAYWEVARGSVIPPRFIIMRYLNNPDSKEIMGLAGKGLTYDSGGYSLKPTSGMFTMKADMGGSASVIGAVTAIAKAKLKVNVIAVVAACENMLSGHSYRPGDVIGSMGGKTIEIENTDAEGRLTLIDAVHYIINHEKVTKVADVATLTGAAVAALGQNYSVIVSNNDEMVKSLIDISKITGEKFWRMPEDPEFKEMLKSKVADLRNIGGKFAGSITAGLFIGEFVNNLPWVHLDIAGPAYTDSANEYKPFGASGTPVRSLYYLVKHLF